MKLWWTSFALMVALIPECVFGHAAPASPANTKGLGEVSKYPWLFPVPGDSIRIQPWFCASSFLPIHHGGIEFHPRGPERTELCHGLLG